MRKLVKNGTDCYFLIIDHLPWTRESACIISFAAQNNRTRLLLQPQVHWVKWCTCGRTWWRQDSNQIILIPLLQIYTFQTTTLPLENWGFIHNGWNNSSSFLTPTKKCHFQLASIVLGWDILNVRMYHGEEIPVILLPYAEIHAWEILQTSYANKGRLYLPLSFR